MRILGVWNTDINPRKAIMLEDRTVNIMLITKRFGGVNNIKEHIAKYMSEECWCPIEVYTDSVLYDIVKTAFLDYIRNTTSNMAAASVREFLEKDGQDLERMILTLGLAQVAERKGEAWYYINGYHDTKFTEKLESGQWT